MGSKAEAHELAVESAGRTMPLGPVDANSFSKK